MLDKIFTISAFIFCIFASLAYAEGFSIPKSVPGTVLIVEPITADNPGRLEYLSAKTNQNFSLGYWHENPIILSLVDKKTPREVCENYITGLMDQYGNPAGYLFIEEKNNILKYQIYLAPHIQVFLFFRVDKQNKLHDKKSQIDVPVGFLYNINKNQWQKSNSK